MELILRKEILEKLKKNPELFGKVMLCLDTTVTYGIQLIYNNDPKLTQASVLRILREYLHIKNDSELLEEQSETVTA